MSKIQILWVAPAFRAFASGDVLTSENLEAAGYSVDHLIDAGEAQILDDAASVTVTLPEPEPAEPELVKLSRLSKAKLLELASEHGLTIAAGSTKSQIIDAIEEAGEQATGA